MKFLFLFVFFSQVSNAYEYNLTIATMFKDEAPFLKEWIEYHKMMGVEHFRLYNNDSEDDFLNVLNPYIANGDVTLIEWPSTKQNLTNWPYLIQWPACSDAINHFKGKSKWLALIDVDEFLHPLEDSDMTSFLKNYENYNGVVLSWQCFGTSNIDKIPEGKLMIEALTLKAGPKSEWNFPVKSIVRPELVDHHATAWPPHTYRYLSRSPAVFPDKRPRKDTKFAHQNRIYVEKAVLNHYVHRAEDYFWDVKIPKKRRMENGGIGFTEALIKRWHDECNLVEDTKIFRFLPSLRERMAK